jgi:hypothetical protein
MDITKAKKIIELSKDNRSILLTLWESGEITSCVKEAEAKKQYCENCQGDESLCNEYAEYLKGKGYQATEVELAELGLEESLPKFLEERAKPEPAIEPQQPPELGSE